MSDRLNVISSPDIEDKRPRAEHLWVLVGGEDYSDGATAFYLGQDRDIEGDDLAGYNIPKMIQSAQGQGIDLDANEVKQALEDYRGKRGAR